MAFATVLLGACAAPLPYQATPVEEQAAPREFLARTTEDNSLAALVSASGYQGSWPPQQWRLDTLTLLALYFNPAMDVARARANAARAALSTAAQRAPLSVQLAAEHHSREVDGPWSLGVAVGLPVGTRTRREARVEKATYLADAAELEIAASAWQVRGAVRDAILALKASRQRAALLEEHLRVQRQLLQLVQRRVDAGMLSSRDLGRERTAAANVAADLAVEQTFQASAYGDLAAALGLPLQTVRALRIADDAIANPATVPDAAAARSRALRNRLDVHTRLLEFGAADAEVRLAVAQQYPTVTLSPGFMWDQGDNVWSLLSGVSVPRGAQASVREAETRRELAARRFAALQIQTITEVEHARELLQASRTGVAAASDIVDQERAQLERVKQFFESGSGDRVQLVTAQLGWVQARQHLLRAQIAARAAAARFEDSMQAPLTGNFPRLPRPAVTPAQAS